MHDGVRGSAADGLTAFGDKNNFHVCEKPAFRGFVRCHGPSQIDLSYFVLLTHKPFTMEIKIGAGYWQASLSSAATSRFTEETPTTLKIKRVFLPRLDDFH